MPKYEVKYHKVARQVKGLPSFETIEAASYAESGKFVDFYDDSNTDGSPRGQKVASVRTEDVASIRHSSE